MPASASAMRLCSRTNKRVHRRQAELLIGADVACDEHGRWIAAAIHEQCVEA